MPNRDPQLASNVLAPIVRVAGPVITGVTAHAVGHPEQRICVRLGDVLLDLADPDAVASLRQKWDATRYLAVQRLPERVSQTWLGHDPKRYPLAATVQLAADVRLYSRWTTGRQTTRTPDHLRVQVDRVIFQVCDLQAWTAISDALFEAQRRSQQP